jgi:hypothetical protein
LIAEDFRADTAASSFKHGHREARIGWAVAKEGEPS